VLEGRPSSWPPREHSSLATTGNDIVQASAGSCNVGRVPAVRGPGCCAARRAAQRLAPDGRHPSRELAGADRTFIENGAEVRDSLVRPARRRSSKRPDPVTGERALSSFTLSRERARVTN
jgi:hypothetical protein